MSQVISFAEYRNAKIRDRMLAAALSGETVIVETRAGPIRAERILCLEYAAEIRNSLGKIFFVEYRDVRAIRAGGVPQISAISEAGEWILPADGVARPEPSRVLAFARRGRRV